MKIGIVTVFDSSNIGSYLQALAMQELIKAHGDEAYFIRTRTRLQTLSLFLGYNYTAETKNIRNIVKHYLYLFIHFHDFLDKLKKYRRYKRDWKQFDHIISAKEAQKLDLVLYGSDEIWNPKKLTFRNPVFYGKGIESENKAAYAISIGDAQKEDYCSKDNLVNLIKSFKSIYLRDAHSQEVMHSLGIQTDGQICDPTLQFDIRSKMKSSQTTQEKKYIAVYSYRYGKEDSDVIEHIQRFAKEHHLKTVAVSLPQDWCDSYCNCSPLEFGQILANAEYVFTTTFHGTIFSALFHTKFAVYSSLPKTMDVLDRLGFAQARLDKGFAYDDLISILEQEKDFSAMETRLMDMRAEALKAYQSVVEITNDHFGVCKKEVCTGCGACAYVCPKKCIAMAEDDIGAIYPNIDESKCIRCQKCKQACPQLKRQECSRSLKAYAAWSKDDDVRKMSASGGIATELYKLFLDNDYSVVGATTNEDFSVSLELSDRQTSIEQYKNSKYVFSDLSKIYVQIQSAIAQNKKICVIAMPCQVAAIKSVFSNNKDIVYVDLICHGMSPVSYLKQHIQSLEQQYGFQASSLSYRDATKDTAKYYFSVFDQEGTCVYSKRMKHGDTYQIGYHKGIIYRENCYHCPYTSVYRTGDMTLGDFTGLYTTAPLPFEVHHVSAMLINTEQGEEVFKRLKGSIEAFERPIEEFVSENRPLRQPTEKTKYRLEFEKGIQKNGGSFENTMQQVVASMSRDKQQSLLKRVFRKIKAVFT